MIQLTIKEEGRADYSMSIALSRKASVSRI